MQRLKSRLAPCAVLSFIVGVASVVPVCADSPVVLSDLMHALAARKSSNAHFIERRYLKMLSEPLKSTGTLTYVAPDKLEKVTLWPRPQRMTVDGDRLFIAPGPDSNPKTLSLATQPEVDAFVEAIRGTLAGDLPVLERFYTVGLAGSWSDWALRLEPKEAGARKLLSSVLLKGQAAAIQSVDIQETDGDRTEMIILEDPP
jgi:hypothetical protein